MFVVYVGNIPSDISNEDLRKELSVHAEAKEVERNFKKESAMVKYDTMEEASGAVERYNGLELNGKQLLVENPRPAKFKGSSSKPPIRYDLRVLIKGLKPGTRWQEIKDWAREAVDGAEVVYSNVFDLDGVHCGLVEYKDMETFERALEALPGKQFKEETVEIEKADPTAAYNSNPPSRAGGARPPLRGPMGGGPGGDRSFRPPFAGSAGGRGGGGAGGYSGHNDRGNDFRGGRDRSYDRHNGPPAAGGFRDRNSRDRQPYDSTRDRGYGGDRGGYSDNRGYSSNTGGYSQGAPSSRDYDAPRGGDYRNDDRGRFNNGGDRRYNDDFRGGSAPSGGYSSNNAGGDFNRGGGRRSSRSRSRSRERGGRTGGYSNAGGDYSRGGGDYNRGGDYNAGRQGGSSGGYDDRRGGNAAGASGGRFYDDHRGGGGYDNHRN